MQFQAFYLAEVSKVIVFSQIELCDFSCFAAVYSEDSALLGHNAAALVSRIPTFRVNVVSSSSRAECLV